MEEADFLCEECGAEFTILAENDDTVNFCPYCGSELEYDEDDEDYNEELDFDEDEEEQ